MKRIALLLLPVLSFVACVNGQDSSQQEESKGVVTVLDVATYKDSIEAGVNLIDVRTPSFLNVEIKKIL